MHPTVIIGAYRNALEDAVAIMEKHRYVIYGDMNIMGIRLQERSSL